TDLMLNLLVVAYLMYRLRRTHSEGRLILV
ncbi:MAG: hypothetical protein QOH59_835, partial [Gemmatimonadales bacterium]|nr:hypothetical protein [Gemmatimonadales bacterium]